MFSVFEWRGRQFYVYPDGSVTSYRPGEDDHAIVWHPPGTADQNGVPVADENDQEFSK